ncbi:hypothetical protein [Caulobacter sp. UC70_42]|uniref:hypothetical protein n=1 Tax=Caulobacter sp. UC70_42 TaxID=3374551 RepID=UPI003757E492
MAKTVAGRPRHSRSIASSGVRPTRPDMAESAAIAWSQPLAGAFGALAKRRVSAAPIELASMTRPLLLS